MYIIPAKHHRHYTDLLRRINDGDDPFAGGGVIEPPEDWPRCTCGRAIPCRHCDSGRQW